MSDTAGTLVVFGGVFFVGAIFGNMTGDEKIEKALSWALNQTAECEQNYEAEGHSNVTECLELAIWSLEDAREYEPF